MKLLADHYLYRLSHFIPEDVQVEYYKPEEGFPRGATGYDAMLIRTVTPIHPDTLPEAGNLKFIGTATAGYDHVDIAHLKRLGIHSSRSAGCNSNAVAEYIITALHHWAEVTGENLQKKKIGIMGMGYTGSGVARYLEKLGIRFAPYDPPRAQRETDFVSCTQEELLQCDILTFHVPLTRSGAHPTWHMGSSEWMEEGFDLILNAARGGVVDEHALLAARRRGRVGDYILDVWEGEPEFRDEIAAEAFIATPHIAGYSKQAKWLASKLVADQMCEFFGLEKRETSFRDTHREELSRMPESGGQRNEPESSALQEMQNVTGSPDSKENSPTLQGRKAERGRSRSDFARFLWKHHKIDFYDSRLRKMIGSDPVTKRREFSLLRSETETRFEFASLLSVLGLTGSLEPDDPLRIFL